MMAALGEITVVVEAAQRSGSLITAERALRLGRRSGRCRAGQGEALRPAKRPDRRRRFVDPRRAATCSTSCSGGSRRGAGPARLALGAPVREVLDVVEPAAATVDAIARELGLGPGRPPSAWRGWSCSATSRRSALGSYAGTAGDAAGGP